MKNIEESQILSFLGFFFLQAYLAEEHLRNAWCPQLHEGGRRKSEEVNCFPAEYEVMQ